MKYNFKTPEQFGNIRLSLSKEAIAMLAESVPTNNDTPEYFTIGALFLDLLATMRVTSGCDDAFKRKLQLLPGMTQFSEVDLAKSLCIGRKKLHRILERMEQAGMILLSYDRIGSFMVFTCVEGWNASEEVANRFHGCADLQTVYKALDDAYGE